MKKILLLAVLTVFSVFFSCTVDDFSEIDDPVTEQTTDNNKKDDSIVDENTNTDGKNTDEGNTDVDNTDVDNTDQGNTDQGNTEVDNTDVDNTDVDNTDDEIINDEIVTVEEEVKEEIKPERTELEKKIVGKWDVAKIKMVFWINTPKSAGQEVYISFSEDGNYNAKIDVKPEFSGQGTYKSTDDKTIVVEGNVKAIISNIKFINNNTIEAHIFSNGQSVNIRATRM